MKLQNLLPIAFYSLLVFAAFYSGRIEAADSDLGSRSYEVTPPLLETNRGEINVAFRVAIGDILGNVKPFKSGLLTEPRPVLIAGLGYAGPWERDSAMNAWNGCSLWLPGVMHNNLLAVLPRKYEEVGIGSQGSNPQYWDAMIWVTGAWHHYLYTGDKEFLKLAFAASKGSMGYYERTEFNAAENLFRGPAWSDGIGAYPEPYCDTGNNAAITAWPAHNPDKVSKPGFGIPMMALSTNCVYYNAYRTLEKMARELDEKPDPRWAEQAEKIKNAINAKLWNEKAGTYRMFIGPFGNSDQEEGLGAAYCILFGIADEKRAASVFAHQHIDPAGLPCGYPNLPRYAGPEGKDFGQHTEVIWPQIQGYWAEAAARHGRADLFRNEFFKLASYGARDFQFSESYHPITGEIYGGMHEGVAGVSVNGPIMLQPSVPRQTWTATSFMRMAIMGMVGMRFDASGIRFAPCVPEGINFVRLQNVRYRNANINVTIKGTGVSVKSCKINGKNATDYFIPCAAEGRQEVALTVGT
jgi:hypothetical protein